MRVLKIHKGIPVKESRKQNELSLKKTTEEPPAKPFAAILREEMQKLADKDRIAP